MSLNRVDLIGYVGKDPVIRYLASGEPVAEFSVATTDQWTERESGDRKESTEWHRIKIIGKKNLIENFVAKYIKQGSHVHIEGKLKTRDYEDKEKVRRWVTEIRVNEIELLDRKPKGDSAPPAGDPANESIPD